MRSPAQGIMKYTILKDPSFESLLYTDVVWSMLNSRKHDF